VLLNALDMKERDIHVKSIVEGLLPNLFLTSVLKAIFWMGHSAKRKQRA
jgi:hypothetical protein